MPGTLAPAASPSPFPTARPRPCPPGNSLPVFSSPPTSPIHPPAETTFPPQPPPALTAAPCPPSTTSRQTASGHCTSSMTARETVALSPAVGASHSSVRRLRQLAPSLLNRHP